MARRDVLEFTHLALGIHYRVRRDNNRVSPVHCSSPGWLVLQMPMERYAIWNDGWRIVRGDKSRLCITQADAEVGQLSGRAGPPERPEGPGEENEEEE